MKNVQRLSCLYIRVLGTNQLTGTIPDVFSTLPNLVDMLVILMFCSLNISKILTKCCIGISFRDLEKNTLDGTIPNSIGYLTNLVDL